MFMKSVDLVKLTTTNFRIFHLLGQIHVFISIYSNVKIAGIVVKNIYNSLGMVYNSQAFVYDSLKFMLVETKIQSKNRC